MRKNGYSAALRDYEASLAQARHLHRIEVARYRDPPPLADQIAVEALRGGATVLMVASFERYLKEALEEYVDLIAKRAVVTSHGKLSAAFVEYNDFNFFNWLIRDSRLPRKEKADELKRVARLVATDGFVPEALSRTRANPAPSTVRDLFSPLRTDSLPLVSKIYWPQTRMMRSWTRRNGWDPLGSLCLHPRCGKIRADVNRQIIQK
jgi:hypothetical protein